MAVVALLGLVAITSTSSNEAVRSLLRPPGADQVTLPDPAAGGGTGADDGADENGAGGETTGPGAVAEEPWREGLRRDLGGRIHLRELAPAPDPAVALDELGSWRLTLDAPTVAAVSVLDTVVVATADGSIHAFDAGSGAHRWSTAVGPRIAELRVVEDRLIVRRALTALVALDPADGSVNWRIDLAGETDDLGTVGGEDGALLLVTRQDERMALGAVDLVTGAPRWSVPLSGGWLRDPTPGGSISAAVGVVDGELQRREPERGGIRWALALSPGERLLPGGDGIAVLSGVAGERWVDLDTGRVRFRSDGDLQAWRTLADGTTVLAGAVGDAAPTVLAVSPGGQERWRFDLGRYGAEAGCCTELTVQPTGEVLIRRDGERPATTVLVDGATGQLRADLTDLIAGAGGLNGRILGVTDELILVTGPATVTGGPATFAVLRASRGVRWFVETPTTVRAAAPVLVVGEPPDDDAGTDRRTGPGTTPDAGSGTLLVLGNRGAEPVAAAPSETGRRVPFQRNWSPRRVR